MTADERTFANDLPDGWVWTTLEAAAEIGGEQILPSNHPERQFNYLALENISQGTGEIVGFSPTIGSEIKSNKFKFSPEHVLYGKLRPYLRKVVAPDFSGISATDLLPLKPAEHCVDRHYLVRWLLSSQILEYVVKRQTGVKMPRLRSRDLRQMPVPLPPLGEQQRIVARIEALFRQSRRARQALDGIPDLLAQFRQAVLAAAFRGELTERHPDDEPAAVLLERIRAERCRRWEEELRAKGKDLGQSKYQEPAPPDTSDLPELPEGWVWVSLGQLLERIEAGRSPRNQGRPAEPGEFGVLKVSAVTWGEFRPEENKALLPEHEPGDAPIVKAGDLLISRANTTSLVGAVVLVKQDYPSLMISDKTLRLVPLSEDIPKRYLLYALRAQWVRDYFASQATGTSDSMRNISQVKIRGAPITLPPVTEQHRIVARVEALFAQADILEAQAAAARRRLEQVDQAILARAFRGELVEQDPEDDPTSVLLERVRRER